MKRDELRGQGLIERLGGCLPFRDGVKQQEEVEGDGEKGDLAKSLRGGRIIERCR